MPKPDESDLTPLYAVAGLADIIAETFRESVAARQRRAEERIAEIRDRRLERVEQARVNADELREFLSTLPEQFRALPETTRVRLAELQRQTEELLAQAGDTYSSLAGRGKRVVGGRVEDVRAGGRRARASAEEGVDDAAEAVQPLVDQAQEVVTEVRRNVTGRAARSRTTTAKADDVTPESATRAARAAAAAASSSTTSTPPSGTDEVSPAQALAQEREAAAGKTPAKKTPAKKTPAKKTAAKKSPVAEKAPSDKPSTKKKATGGTAPVAASAPTDVTADEVTGPGTAS